MSYWFLERSAQPSPAQPSPAQPSPAQPSRSGKTTVWYSDTPFQVQRLSKTSWQAGYGYTLVRTGICRRQEVIISMMVASLNRDHDTSTRTDLLKYEPGRSEIKCNDTLCIESKPRPATLTSILQIARFTTAEDELKPSRVMCSWC